MFEGQTTTGAIPTTVTVNEHSAVLSPASVTLCVTVVTPIGKVAPLAKPAVLVVVEEQLSVPTGVVYATTLPDALVAITEILEGQEIVGAILSTTVTVAFAEETLPLASVTNNATVLFPILLQLNTLD